MVRECTNENMGLVSHARAEAAQENEERSFSPSIRKRQPCVSSPHGCSVDEESCQAAVERVVALAAICTSYLPQSLGGSQVAPSTAALQQGGGR